MKIKNLDKDETKDIRELLENLGSKVSLLAEENRLSQNRENAARNLFQLLKDYISKDKWLDLYNSIDDTYVKNLMLEWGNHIFPDTFKNNNNKK